MNILHLTSRMGIGGAETHILSLAVEQARLGHRVFCASSGGVNAELLQELGVEHATLPLDRKIPASLAASCKGILNIIKEKHIDIIHAHSRIPAFATRLISREVKKLGCTFICTAHMPFRTGFPLRSLSEWGDGTIAVSSDVREYLVREYGLEKSRICVIENGIDTEKFCPADTQSRWAVRDRLGISRDGNVICCACRSSVSRAAAALYLCKHATEILGKEDTLLLLLSGAVGDERDIQGELCAVADAANTALGRAAVVCVVGESDISLYLSASDIFVGVSRAALEAMSCGLGVVIAGNEGYGGVVCAENIEGLRSANFTGRGSYGSFSDIKTDIEKIKKLGLSELGSFCREYVCRELTAQLMAHKVCRFYELTAEENKRGHLLVVGHFGAGNFGDDEVCRAISRRLGDRYKLHFICKDKSKLGALVKGEGVRREDIFSIVREVKRAECVIFGGGNLLQDDTSMRSLLYYEKIFEIAYNCGKKRAIFANGIGPLHTDKAIDIAEKMISASHYVSFREDCSYGYIESSDLIDDFWLSADVTYTADIKKALQPKVAQGLFGYLNGKKYAVLCPRGGMNDRDRAAVAEYFTMLEKQGVITVIIPLYTKADSNICRTLHRMIARSCIYFGKLDAERLTLILGGAELCVGGRLHSGIFSIIAECPFVGYDSDGRVRANTSHAECGAYLHSGRFCAKHIERAADKQKKLVREGKYKKAHARLRHAAEEDFARLIKLIEG